MKQILISNYKGGVGKSTTATNLAHYLSGCGKVLLIDDDPNRSATKFSKRSTGDLPYKVCTRQQAPMVVANSQSDQYDYAIIDTAARPDSNDLEDYAEGSDLIIVPLGPTIDDLDPTLEAVATLSKLGYENYRLLLCNVPPKPSKEGQNLYDELSSSGYPLFDKWIRRSAGVPKAALQGVPIAQMVGNYRWAWMDYQAVGQQVEQLLSQ